MFIKIPVNQEIIEFKNRQIPAAGQKVSGNRINQKVKIYFHRTGFPI